MLSQPDELPTSRNHDGLWQHIRDKAREYDGIAVVIPVHPQVEGYDEEGEPVAVTVVAVFARILDRGMHPNKLSLAGCTTAVRKVREWGYTPRWEDPQ